MTRPGKEVILQNTKPQYKSGTYGKQKLLLKGKLLALWLVIYYWHIDLAWSFNVQRWGKENQFNFPQSHAYIQLLCIFLFQHNILWDTNYKQLLQLCFYLNRCISIITRHWELSIYIYVIPTGRRSVSSLKLVSSYLERQVRGANFHVKQL